MKKPLLLSLFGIALVLLALSACRGDIVRIPGNAGPVDVESPVVTFAVIGDYGHAGPTEAAVADMVKGWQPDCILTAGDNNYPSGKPETLNENIGQYYCDYIYNPDAPVDQRCEGRATQEQQNRFFPSPGNHDFNSQLGLLPYANYFTLPGNELYYEFKWGPVHFFSLNSGPGGQENCCETQQSQWLESHLAASERPWKIVYFHHSPWSESGHGNAEEMQWPFREWGGNAVITGHDHVYQRMIEKQYPDFLYLVCGLSGKASKYGCGDNPLDPARFESFCYNDSHGALYVHATRERITFQFRSVEDPDQALGTFVLTRTANPLDDPVQ